MALDFVEALMEEMGDNPKEPRWVLLEIVTKSIDEYEARVEPEMACVFESYGCTSILRVLMVQYQLRPSDFPEIGSQEVVGQVLNGKRQLNFNQVTALSQRFGVEQNLFFFLVSLYFWANAANKNLSFFPKSLSRSIEGSDFFNLGCCPHYYDRTKSNCQATDLGSKEEFVPQCNKARHLFFYAYTR
ncbi:MAG: hypothetical protein ABFS56_22010 [Pseudomonadota bacterium]